MNAGSAAAAEADAHRVIPPRRGVTPQPTDSVTILRCTRDHRATKLVRASAGGGVRIDGFDAGKFTAVTERQVAGITELARALDEVSLDPRCFVIRGEPLVGINRERCRRLFYKHEDGTPPTFREVPRCWVIIDFDDPPGPYRFNPRDGTLAAIYCRGRCCRPHGTVASFWWALSSSAGFKPGVRIKLGVLERPPGDLASSWSASSPGCPIDASTLRPLPADLRGSCLSWWTSPIRSASAAASRRTSTTPWPLPELVSEAAPVRASLSCRLLGRRYVSGASQSVAEKRLDALCGAIERAGVGRRHRCLIWSAARAVELDDALPREHIAVELSPPRAGLGSWTATAICSDRCATASASGFSAPRPLHERLQLRRRAGD